MKKLLATSLILSVIFGILIGITDIQIFMILFLVCVSPLVIYSVSSLLYVWVWRPIKILIKKIKGE